MWVWPGDSRMKSPTLIFWTSIVTRGIRWPTTTGQRRRSCCSVAGGWTWWWWGPEPGGTVAGIGRKLKEKLPHVQVVGVDPLGSVLAEPPELNDTDVTGYHVEGIGYDFLPTVLDRGVVDQWYKSNDKDSFAFARRLIAEEGLLCGGSSGSALSAALKAARELKEGQTCVVVLPDSVRNYLTKFVDDQWMVCEGLMDCEVPAGGGWWWSQPLSVLPLLPIITVGEQVTCGEAVKLLQEKQIDQVPILTDNGDVLGMVTLSNLTTKMVRGQANTSDPVTSVSYTQFRKVMPNTSLGQLSKILEKDHYAIVMHDSNKRDARGEKISTVGGVVTSIDLLQYISSQQQQ
ncbi:Cystathionine beta-synthase [Geodia barretti]|uniref:Cystathionine beta-synthase n=1 Tax=Geodia barretti TaxID=519541 RepID=A0AA35TK39_GEOBA|nr:Cystathionine beta-synthase [Geodia barretti]